MSANGIVSSEEELASYQRDVSNVIRRSTSGHKNSKTKDSGK